MNSLKNVNFKLEKQIKKLECKLRDHDTDVTSLSELIKSLKKENSILENQIKRKSYEIEEMKRTNFLTIEELKEKHDKDLSRIKLLQNQESLKLEKALQT